MQLITEDEKIYKESVNAIENLLNASEKNKFRALAYGDLLVRKDEILNTPKIKPVAEILLYLHHLDLLYLNLKAIENGEGILTNNFKDSSTKIREFFDAMDPDKNEWESVFKSEKDYDTFCHLLTCYYDNKKYELPSEKIEMEPNMKGKIGLVLGTIHLEFKGTYICNEEYCKIINVLKPFKDKKRPQVYDIIRR